MSESFEQNIVSLLEDHVELAISTVQKLRAEKLELEAEIARLNNDVLQRDANIQDLETRNSELEEELNLERLATTQERSEIRERLEGLMAVLAPSVLTPSSSDETVEDTGTEISFTPQGNEPDDAPSLPTAGSESSGEDEDN